jgi:hypothetical protein
VCAVQILRRLLERFPEPSWLDADVLQGEIAELYPDCKILGTMATDGENIVTWTIRFLINEGFVRATKDSRTYFEGCTLTRKGLLALNQPLEALDPKLTLKRRLIDAGKRIAPELAAAIIARLFTS